MPVVLKLNTTLFSADSASQDAIDGRISYSIVGQLYPTANGSLPLNASLVELDKSTPIKSLTELMLAFKSGDVTRIVQMFIAANRAEVRADYDNPSSGPELLNSVKSITDAKVLLVVQSGQGLTAFVRIVDRSGVSVEPYGLVQEAGKYYFSPQSAEGPMFANFFLFLSSNEVTAIE